MKESWAERECRIACKRENPSFNFDSDDFDYGCSCYKSALNAYNSMMKDGHSGTSFSFTKNILIRLMDGLPLTPITDDDFPKVEYDPTNEWLKEQKLKSDVQCPRMTSLFRQESLDGKVSYIDVNRAYSVDIEEPSDTYYSGCRIIDELFPITLPYYPTPNGKYKIYEQTFLTDPANGDFDTKGILYIETPDGEKININRYSAEKDGKWSSISKEEYEERLKKRVDKLNEKIASHLLWTLLENSASDDECTRRKSNYNNRLTQTEKSRIMNDLDDMCKFFDNPDRYQYNTFNITQAMCRGNKQALKDLPQALHDITDYLSGILERIS